MQAIDIHTHVVPYDFPAYAGASGGTSWPSTAECSQRNHRNVMIDACGLIEIGDRLEFGS